MGEMIPTNVLNRCAIFLFLLGFAKQVALSTANCRNWCHKHAQHWDLKCSWNQCWTCGECQVETATWRFVVLADWHGGEGFVFNPVSEEDPVGKHMERFGAIQSIHEDYGGELALIPGDTNTGHWYKEKTMANFGADSPQEAVEKAGENCYRSLRLFFGEAGYSTLLVAMGDHEIGGNPWPKGKLKTNLLPQFRNAFVKGLNLRANGKFLHKYRIGDIIARPVGTPFAQTSYAKQHKNVLFVTVDAFKQLPKNFWDKKQGLGGEGSVTGTVDGEHLEWFRNVLSTAQNDPSINHVIVQAHLPIVQPVRKINCSGQFMDYAEQSPFWKAMQEFNVDVYFAGEVHTNTATKDRGSNLVQVVSRGNRANNFLTVDVTKHSILITSYNEIGTKARFNGEYVSHGHLLIDKSGAETTIASGGVLKLLDREKPLIHLTFDEIYTLEERPVLGLKHDELEETLVQRKITIRGVECWDSIPNNGSYDRQYDAQVGNITLDDADAVKGKAVVFNSNSRVAIWGIGPHSGGHEVSYALWFKTFENLKNQILIHFGVIWGGSGYGVTKNPIFSLTLEEQGIPALHAAPSGEKHLQKLISLEEENLANGEWQHLAISMPRKSCRLSEVQMFVNGRMVDTKVEGRDTNLFLHTAGQVSVGGFGSSGSAMEDMLPHHENFVGSIDEVYVWGRALFEDDVQAMFQVR